MKQLPIMRKSELNKDGKTHIIMGNIVFDITTYQSRHPGKSLILKAQHQDGFECLIKRHGRNSRILEQRLLETAVGRLPPEEREDLSEQKAIFEADDNHVYNLFVKLFGEP